MTNLYRLAVVLLIAIATANAATIYQNGAPNLDSGNEMTSRLQAEDFVLNEANSLTGVRFWAFYYNDLAAGYLGSVAWGIYADSNGQPGSVLFYGLVTPVLSAGSENCCAGIAAELQFGLPNISLASGTYWLALHNGPTSRTSNEDFYWQTTDANSSVRGVEQAAPFGQSIWQNTNQEHAFELQGNSLPATAPVPEPSTFFLVGSVIVGLIWQRRR